jgi:hypothetical protein
VCKFNYLGSTVANDCDLGQEAAVTERLKAARGNFGKLQALWKNSAIPVRVKGRVLAACVLTAALWGIEGWTLRFKTRARLQRCWTSWLRRICGVSPHTCWVRHISNAQLEERCGLPSIQVTCWRLWAGWLGHVVRRRESWLPQRLLFGTLADRGPQPSGGSGLLKRLTLTFRTVVRRMGLEDHSWHRQAQDRASWRSLVRTQKWAKPSGGHDLNVRLGGRVTHLRCVICDKECGSRPALTRHFNTVHPLHART